MIPESSHIVWLAAETSSAAKARRTMLRLVEGNGTGDPVTGEVPSFAEALARLDELIRQGRIEKRDLKCRFDGCTVREEDEARTVEVRIGSTQYYAIMRDIDLTAQTARKAALGKQRHGDPRRYLECGIGVLVLPYSDDGRVLLGIRDGDTYAGRLHGPSGWLPFECDVMRIDPAAHARIECEEELGIGDGQLDDLELLGIVSFRDTYETDFVFGAHMPDERFELLIGREEWRQARDAHEHTDFMALTPAEALAADGAILSKLLPSTEYGLRTLGARRCSLPQ